MEDGFVDMAEPATTRLTRTSHSLYAEFISSRLVPENYKICAFVCRTGFPLDPLPINPDGDSVSCIGTTGVPEIGPCGLHDLIRKFGRSMNN